MRNAAAGLLRRKERSPYVDYLSYVCYELPGEDITPQEARRIITARTEFKATSMQELASPNSALAEIEAYYDALKMQESTGLCSNKK